MFLDDDDAILPRRGSITRAMARRLQKDWYRDAGEGHSILMSLRVDFEPMV